MKKNLIFELIPFLLHLKYKANGFSYMKIYKMRGRILLLEVIDPAYICWTHSLFLLVLLCLIGKLNSASLCFHCVPMSACLHLNLWGTGGGWNIWERGKFGISFSSFKGFQGCWQHFLPPLSARWTKDLESIIMASFLCFSNTPLPIPRLPTVGGEIYLFFLL